MLRSSLLALLAATAAATLVDATIVTITNQCGERVDLWDNKASVPLSPGESVMRDLPNGYQGMFRNGVNPQATLAEFTIDGGKFWYDISIIPTGPKSGPDYCGSLEECKAYTGGVGYNTPMQIKVGGCKTRTCLFDGCDDAYQYPKDDTKTTACGMFSPVDLIFCPGGPGGQSAPILPPITLAPVTPAPTPKPTTQAPTPEPTTQAPTPEPTTKAPTPEPTTQAPTPEPTTQAPTPEPTTAAPTPEPTTEAPAKLRSADDASSDSSSAGSRASSLESRSIGDFDTVGSGSADNSNTIGSGSAGDSNTVGSGSAGGSNTVGSGSTATGSAFDAGDSRSEPSSGLFGTTIVLTPGRSDTVANEGDRSTGEAPKDASVQSASDQSGGVSSMLLVVLGAVGSVAGVAVFVAAKKRKEMEEETNETKDSLDSAVAFEEGDGNGLLTPIDNIQCI